MALSVGSLLAGRYEITAPIATGGMGEVWRARDRVLDRIVAAKVLKSEYMSDPSSSPGSATRPATAALTHQNIASVYDYGETVDDSGTQQLAFLVMEFVEGHPLVTILHDEHRLPVDWTLHVLSQSADGLSAAHKAGVVHRDIKPGNLMVRPDGVVKLTDFGIAQARDAAPLTRTGMVVGTAQYLSPEQAQGMEVTAASDVYSLGVVAYECLSGERPFDGASQVAIALAHINRPPPPLPADIPPAVRLLVERALAKDAADRFPDGAAFAAAIRRVASVARWPPCPGRPRRRPRSSTAGWPTPGRRFSPRPAPPPSPVPVELVPARDRPGRCRPHASPDDDDDWGQEDEPEDPGRGRGKRWALLAAALLLLLLLGGGAYYLLVSGNRGRDDTTTTPTTSTSAGATGVLIDSSRYVGRPVDEVHAGSSGWASSWRWASPPTNWSARPGGSSRPRTSSRSIPATRPCSRDPRDRVLRRRGVRPRRRRGAARAHGRTDDRGPHHERGAPTTSEAPTPTAAATSSSAVPRPRPRSAGPRHRRRPSPSPTEEAPAAIEEPTG